MLRGSVFCVTVMLALAAASSAWAQQQQLGTVVVQKQTQPPFTGQLFDFSLSTPTNASIPHNGQILVDVQPGQYTATETVPAGWALTSIMCDDTDSTGDVTTATATYNIQPGETVTCVFTNTQNGQIVVRKSTQPPGSLQQFMFGGAVVANLSDGGSASAAVQPGSYTVTETVPAGWTLTSIVCDDGDSTGDVATATATFNVQAAEEVTCVFENTEAQTAPALPPWAVAGLALLLAAGGIAASRRLGRSSPAR